MANSSSPPPPPPFNSVVSRHNLVAVKKSLITECLWAQDYADLQKACYLRRVCQLKNPRHCQFNVIQSVRQVGPTCGFAALDMLLDGKVPTVELLGLAKRLGYTNNGEMYSAEYLRQILAVHIQPPCECLLFEGELNCAAIKEHLVAGACILVPYDADFDHSPCLKFGHKAHWALIVGYLITDHNEFYVLARHGKTTNVTVWPLADLSSSNANLLEFGQPKGYDDSVFKLPPGGISGQLGLNERAIIVRDLPHKIVKIQV